MRTKLTAELDELIATYIITTLEHKRHLRAKELPSNRFSHVFKLLEALKDLEE